jgi:hypothetical protein
MSIKRIIYFDHWQSATEYYRLMPLDYITNESFTITRSTEREIQSHLLNRYDVVIISRPSSEAHLNLIRLAKDLHMKVIGDYDDDTLHVPETNPMYGTYENDKRHTLKCLALLDEIWVATEGIKQSFRLFNKNIHVIPNSHNDTVFPVERKMPFGAKKRIMWRGGGSHIGDIYQPGTAEWIVKTINSNKKWDFYWLGQKFEWIEYRVKQGNFFHNPGGSTVQFYKMIHEMNPQVFWYPLTDNLFNRSKSACSWLEATYSGAAYFGKVAFPEFQKPGIKQLAELPYMLKHPYELEKMNTESWEFISDELLLSKINLLREQRLLAI